MFQLEKEVKAWCSSILPDDCARNERVEELEDHLYSEIERLKAEGLTPEQAFAAATRQLGEAKMLMSEYSKNRTFLSRLCELDRQLSGSSRPTNPSLRKKAGQLLIGHAILWAAAMLATSLLIEDSETVTTVSIMVLMPLWFVSFMLINYTFRSTKPDRES